MKGWKSKNSLVITTVSLQDGNQWSSSPGMYGLCNPLWSPLVITTDLCGQWNIVRVRMYNVQVSVIKALKPLTWSIRSLAPGESSYHVRAFKKPTWRGYTLSASICQPYELAPLGMDSLAPEKSSKNCRPSWHLTSCHERSWDRAACLSFSQSPHLYIQL